MIKCHQEGGFNPLMKKSTTANRLRYLMTTRNLKQIDILRAAEPYAAQFNVKMNRSDISQYVSGKVEPGQDKLTILGLALGVDPVWLMGIDVPMIPQEDKEMLPHPDVLPVTVRHVPILGSAACGEPIYAPGDGTEFLSVDSSVSCDFALIAHGDSMIGDRIHDGDVVYFCSVSDVRDGEIAAVAIDDGVSIKRIKRLRAPDGSVIFTQLLSSNPAYDSIDIGGPDETRIARILGRAVSFSAKLNT